MGISKIHHHGFTVSNLDQSISFYRELLGLELVRVSDRSNLPSYDRILGYENVHLKIAILQHPENAFILELVQYLHPQVEPRIQENRFLGASHLAFEVEDVDAMYGTLKDAGFGAINPPTDVERDGKVVARAMYALDPDGISIEMFQEYEDVVSQ
ncbi:MAG: VOC family protein [bacterium]|nr:VOC family protein [bacterium]